MVDTFLPALRQLVARELRSQGFSQGKISRLLGITQASVSLYFSSSPERAYSSLKSLAVGRDEADRYAALLSEDVKRSALYAQETLATTWRSLLSSGKACELHRERYPALADCDICMRDFGSTRAVGSDAIGEVSDAVRALESSPSFASVMPEVAVNIAYAPTGSETTDDVVAVPGRIVRIRNRVRVAQEPEFGASKHLAKMLLLVQKRRKDTGACINLRYDARIARALKKLGLRSISIGGYPPSPSGDPTVIALTNRLLSSAIGFDAVVDTGGKGIEPNVYLFAKGAREVADLAIRVSRLYSAS
jgi:predicted fused transcriptional regulator/phosphomethylpyrimidine kinase/predicted transcriptional regulator